MSYSIGRISIENFKHIEKLLLNFNEFVLILLDGPNGFGKTTIFDAIELILTNKISRVLNTKDKRYGYEKLLLAKDETKDTIIKIEFCKEDDRVTIVKKIDSTKVRRKKDKQPDNWQIFETYYLNDFDDQLIEENLKANIDLSVFYQIDKYFNLFYYVQQEDNILFLKKDSKTRMSEISTLFDTELEQKQKKELEDCKIKLNTYKGDLKKKIDEKTKDYRKLLGDVNKKDKEYEEVNYFSLLPESKFTPLWDKKIEQLQLETKDAYLAELRNLYILKNKSDQFFYAVENHEIENYANNTRLLRSTVIALSFLNQFEDFKQLDIKEKKLNSLLEKINNQNLIRNLTDFPFEQIEDYIEESTNVETIKSIIADLIRQKSNMSNLSSLVQELNSTRNILREQFNGFIKHDKDEEGNCPFCGESQNSYDELLNKISQKTKLFNSYYDDFSKDYESKFNDFYREFIIPINNNINNYLQREEVILDKGFFNQLSQNEKNIIAVKDFSEWCLKKGINILALTNNKKEFISEKDIEISVIQIAEKIRNTKNIIEKGFEETNEYFLNLKNMYTNILDNNKENLEKISLKNIMRKADYVNYQYYNHATKAVQTLKKEIEELEKKILGMEYIIVKLTDTIEIFENKIIEHWKKIIKNIEVPFYIYSGKILQDYQKGRGIFIKESTNQNEKTISFVAGSESDQDVINYFSSGQLSAMIIAFTLSLNKIYSNKAIDILMIDDPVQTMDEVNMASFVEVLRNDFRDKQIIISTHEEDIARYMRYKFKKYNLATTGINMKNEIYDNLLV